MLQLWWDLWQRGREIVPSFVPTEVVEWCFTSQQQAAASIGSNYRRQVVYTCVYCWIYAIWIVMPSSPALNQPSLLQRTFWWLTIFWNDWNHTISRTFLVGSRKFTTKSRVSPDKKIRFCSSIIWNCSWISQINYDPNIK